MNIYLIGFSGTGKTSSGLEAAKILHCKFLDTDKQIEIDQGKTIAQIFEECGEKYFRSLNSHLTWMLQFAAKFERWSKSAFALDLILIISCNILIGPIAPLYFIFSILIAQYVNINRF